MTMKAMTMTTIVRVSPSSSPPSYLTATMTAAAAAAWYDDDGVARGWRMEPKRAVSRGCWCGWM